MEYIGAAGFRQVNYSQRRGDLCRVHVGDLGEGGMMQREKVQASVTDKMFVFHISNQQIGSSPG